VQVHADGSISANNSGIEMGQGINTKVEQAVAFELSKTAPVAMGVISTVLPKSTDTFPAASPTWYGALLSLAANPP
jgi:xanthine dehydrogenase molybdopterin-binding subunit B